jgi:hypothetical protein
VTNSFQKLRAHLHGLPAGPVEEAGYTLALLGMAFGTFEGASDHAALLSGARNVRWAPPILSFDLPAQHVTTREGKMVETTSWHFDVATATASATRTRQPFVKPERKRRTA